MTMTATTDSNTGAAVVPAWPSMRGNRRNTGARIFHWDGVPRAIRFVDTFQLTKLLSLINATPIVGPDETIYVGSSNQHFFSLQADGTSSAAPVGNIVDSAGCFVASGSLYFPCGDYSLYALASPPPSIPVRRSLAGTVDSVSTINWFEGNVVADASNHLYAGCDNFFLFSCSGLGQTPFFRWGFPTGFFIWSACAFSDDGETAYFASADMTCYALDLTTTRPDKRQRWACDLDNLCASSPALTADGRILIGAFDGLFYGIDAATGTRVWTFDTGSLIYASPALTDDGTRAFVMSSDGVIRAFDVRGGEPRLVWEFFTGMPGFSSPAIGPDPEGQVPYLIYVASGNGSIFALGPGGRRRWSYDTAALSPEWDRLPHVDPAYWTSLRYPAINASIALGNQGVVTATSGGLVLSVPYDAYLRDTRGFTTVPEDDYLNQLPPSGLRLCYVSPSGRMAATIVSPAAPGTSVTLYAQQTLTFAALSRHTYAGGKARSTFATLPPGLRVSIGSVPYAGWRLSADATQLYVDPPPSEDGFTLNVTDASGALLGVVSVLVRPVTQPSSAAAVLARRYVVEQMSVYAPFVVPALDQLGIATIQIPLRFLSIEDGVAIAYAYESYSSGAAGAPARNLLYVLVGSYANGTFRLESGPSYFELTGAPVPVDRLTLSGVLSEDPAERNGVSLTASYRSTLVSLVEWLLTYLSHWLAFDGASAPGLHKASSSRRTGAFDFPHWLATLKGRVEGAVSAWPPVLRFLERVWDSDVMKPWKLFNQDDEFFWVGTYSLGIGPLSIEAPPRATYAYDGISQTLTVTVHLAEPFPEGQPPVVGIILFDDSTPAKPLLLNYVDRNGSPSYGPDRRSITQTLDTLFDETSGSQPASPVRATVMVNLELATPTFVIPSS